MNPGPSAPAALAALMELVARLRAPDGCPWDRKQTPATVAAYLLEESYEAVEAVEAGQAGEILGELGDVLFQVVFLAHLHEERELFDLAQVIETVRAKMVRRHPHVFGQEPQVQEAEEVKGLWARIKRQERQDHPQGALEGVPAAAPALSRAHRLGQRAQGAGLAPPRAILELEHQAQLLEGLRSAPTPGQAQEDLGRLLFSLAQWARLEGLDSEAALRGANAAFARAFAQAEAQLKDQDHSRQQAIWQGQSPVEPHNKEPKGD